MSNDVIWAAEGTYRPDQGAGRTQYNQAESFTLSSNRSLLGGFAAGDTAITDRNVKEHVTVLNGDLYNNDVPDFSSHSDNSNSIVITSDALNVTIDGFTITGAYHNGIYNNDGSPRISNCVIRSCCGDNYFEGGMQNWQADDVKIINCVFEDNKQSAISLYGSDDSIVKGCYFSGNKYGIQRIQLISATRSETGGELLH